MTSIYPSSTSSNTNNSTSSKNLLRISGMASGIDTDSVVKSMVSSYQAKIDKENQAKQILQWKQEAYRDIIKDIKGLQDYFDPISSKYILSGNSLNINSATSDDTSIISATAGSAAKAGTYNIKVSQLAEQAKIEGKAQNSISQVTSATEWSGAKLTIGGTSITLDSVTDGESLEQVVANINSKISAASLSSKISATCVSDTNGSHIKFDNISGSDITLAAKTSSNSDLISTTTVSAGSSCNSSNYTKDASNWSGANLTFNVGGTNISINLDSITDTNGNGTTLDDIVANINKKISAKQGLNGEVSASYINDGTNSYIKFTNTSTQSISLTAKTSNNYQFISNQNVNTGISSASKLVSDLGFTAGNVSFTVTNGTTDSNVSLTVDTNTTMKSLMDQVNNATSGAVTMSIDNTTGKISFQSKDYGSASNISITNLNTSSTNVIQKLGIKDSATTSETFAGIQGKDAVVAITSPGKASAVTTTQSSNNFTVDGVTYNLVAVNTTANPDSNITVTGNSDTVVSNLKKFIDDYNSVITKINTKLTEKKDSDYAPLTDSQKESMSEDQITAWEAKAKVGILRNDENLSSLLTQLRGAFSSPVYSSYTSSSTNTKISLNLGTYGSSAIGINTSSDYSEGGKLYITDSTKLKNAIENNFEDFKKLFIGASSDTVSANKSYVGSTKYMEDGIFTRMDGILRDYVAAPGIGEDGTYSLSGIMNIFVNKQYDSSISGTSGKNTLPDQVYSKTLSIKNLKTQMSDAETRYYNKFTALETAMNNLNAQQSQLSAMLGTS